MKRTRGVCALVLLQLLALPAGAQSDNYYEPIPYYNDNPFLFCTLGVPGDCWAPVDPATGTFTITNIYCYNPISALQFARVCPKAFPNGLQGAGVATE
ncbi:hypothetical protein IAE57_02130 [Stenotrophomonas sp. S48]|uniref:hypothetical protein n=1 Tax=unclassified Stenotrophomonas TaxID=196198 RepID=UPI001900B2AC|nr:MULTISPECIES: hypothetical protein [unclassified Stenotrophomonas]MBK0024947.1 hypothetical protein [Stenotrophomonas sp. S48]MBK0047187.1 hypothetical protein [Stenotrophomonas sp. S49]